MIMLGKEKLQNLNDFFSEELCKLLLIYVKLVIMYYV